MHLPKFIKRHQKIFIVLGILVVILAIVRPGSKSEPAWTTTTVELGEVRSLVSISGAVDAVGTAELAFPVSGILESILVTEGNEVRKGQLLATLGRSDLNAEYRDAQAALLIAEADRDELISGIRAEERAVTKTTVEIAREDLNRITKEQDERVQNAHQVLLSTDLEAFPEDKNRGDEAPTVSGTYQCGAQGTYKVEVFRSGARSGYSYRLSGLETGTYTAFTESPAPLGSCGLQIQFIENMSYSNSVWEIPIPNTQSSSYVTNKNAYDLAVTTRENTIAAAKQALQLAEQNEIVDIADPRSEARARAEARVLQALARVQAIDAQLADHALYAPFDGTITKVEPVVGETVSTEPVITMISDDAYIITALVPEIDITKIRVGQKAEVVFDARQNETLEATIAFISPLAREIDGVSYFEAKLTLDSDIDWLRSGLNADIDILIEKRENVTRIPKRYLMEENGSYTVFVPNDEERISKKVDLGFVGNDGFVEIIGLDAGATIVAP